MFEKMSHTIDHNAMPVAVLERNIKKYLRGLRLDIEKSRNVRNAALSSSSQWNNQQCII